MTAREFLIWWLVKFETPLHSCAAVDLSLCNVSQESLPAEYRKGFAAWKKASRGRRAALLASVRGTK